MEVAVGRHSEVVQRDQGYGFIQPDTGGKDVVHISAIERAGLNDLREGANEGVVNCGKESAENLKVG
jgi:cold shock protein